MSTQIIWLPPAFDRMNTIVRTFPERKAEFAAALKGFRWPLLHIRSELANRVHHHTE
jgi:hypothetical protein